MLGFIFTFLGMLISSFLVDFHPIFYVIFVLSWVLAVVISAIISTVYTDIVVFEFFSTLPTVMPFAAFVFNYLPMIMTVIGFLLAAVMFVRIRAGQYNIR
jgi:hypothetical protein